MDGVKDVLPIKENDGRAIVKPMGVACVPVRSKHSSRKRRGKLLASALENKRPARAWRCCIGYSQAGMRTSSPHAAARAAQRSPACVVIRRPSILARMHNGHHHHGYTYQAIPALTLHVRQSSLPYALTFHPTRLCRFNVSEGSSSRMAYVHHFAGWTFVLALLALGE